MHLNYKLKGENSSIIDLKCHFTSKSIRLFFFLFLPFFVPRAMALQRRKQKRNDIDRRLIMSIGVSQRGTVDTEGHCNKRFLSGYVQAATIYYICNNCTDKCLSCSISRKTNNDEEKNGREIKANRENGCFFCYYRKKIYK